MSFISATFLVFFLAVLLIWRMLPFDRAKQFLVLANFLFYGYWFPPFVLVLFLSVLTNFYCARQIQAQRAVAKRWFSLALVINLGLLFGFKYVNFFFESVNGISFWLGSKASFRYLDIILPLGISFFTFQGLSFVIDVYRNKFSNTASATDVLLYLSFFPTITAGPILRAKEFLSQLRERPVINESDWQFAVYRICRGFFLKVVIADNIALSVKSIFSGEYAAASFVAWAGAIFFSVQIFCDFAGYSDIAIGSSRLLGFHLPENFNNPYLAAGISDFWRRWHISLTSWFRDYVYLPLSLSTWMRDHIYSRLKDTPFYDYRTDMNLLGMFLLSGLWHGPAWTFVLWGGLHGLAAVFDKHLAVDWSRSASRWRRFFNKAGLILLTFILVSLAWVPFASSSLIHALTYWKAMFLGHFDAFPLNGSIMNGAVWLIFFLLYLGVAGLKEAGIFAENGKLERVESWAYFALLLLIPSVAIDFIYAKF